MAEIKKETREKIQQMQLLEQSAQQLHIQKQQFQSQLYEIEAALKELKDKKTAYKLIGNIMVSLPVADLEKELNEKKEILKLRNESIERQESQIKEKAKKIQEEILKELKPA